MNSKCLERETIFGLVRGLLEPEENAEARRHLLHCAECLRVAQDFEKLDAVLDEWSEEQPSPGFDQKLKRAIISHRPAPSLRFFLTLPSTRAFATAMVALIVVAGSFMIYHFHGTTPDAQITPPAERVYPAPAIQPAGQAPAQTAPEQQPLAPEEELKMYQNLSVLENFDLLENFDVLSELPKGGKVGR